MKQITLWHTGDIHSQVEKFSCIVSYVKKHRQSQDLFLDAGDFCDFFRPMINGTKGLAGIRLLKAAGVDALAVGNNEFLASDQYLADMSLAGVRLLTCNLTKIDPKIDWAVKPYTIFERQGIRFLVIGSSPFWKDTRPEDFLDRIGMFSTDPILGIGEVLAKTAGQYDIAVLLSHSGIRYDRQIAKTFPELDVILGGHSHTFMDEAESVNGVLIQHTGCYAKKLGQVVLSFDEDNHLVDKHAKTFPVFGQSDPVFDQLIKQEDALGTKLLARPLFTMKEVLPFKAFEECEAVNAVCDAMYDRYGGDLALINNSILVGPLGPVISKLSLLEISPSGLMPTTVWWYGNQLQDALKASLDWNRITGSGKGAGNRSPFLGTLSFSHNVRIQDGQLWINGAPVESDRLYEVVTSDYLQRGSGYEMLGPSKGKTIYHTGYIRDLLVMQLQNETVLKEAKEIRYEKVKK